MIAGMSGTALHIGIVACSAEGAALCYRTICSEGASLMGPYNHPEVSMHTPPFVEHVNCMRAGDWQGVADQLIASARKLAAIGADFAICPDNTAHRAMHLVDSHSPLPWLHIAEEVARESARLGYRKVGLTGTKALVESEVYPEKLAGFGITFVRPDLKERERMDDIIFQELVGGIFTQDSLQYLGSVVTGMKSAGCDAVVLGCTELPLLAGEATLALPTLDSTRLLARAALARALASRLRSPTLPFG
jgi:aspartate racemase